MPGTIEELENAIEDLRSQANSIMFLNQNILEEYENRQQKVCIWFCLNIWTYFRSNWICSQIEALTKKQEADEKDLNTCLDEINSLKASRQWVSYAVSDIFIT